MKRPNFRDSQFWIELRKKTSLDEVIGFEECSFWCNEALTILEEYGQHGFIKIENTVSQRVITRYKLFVNTHRFLARKYSNLIFIADGTAGQIHQDYPLGYYDYLNNSPRPLNLFYLSAIKFLRYN